jgi:delta-aminolevulinic acid dehydratase/porphobilinogen synthase
MHLTELLGDKAQAEAHFGPFRDSANLDEVCSLRRTYQGWEINLDAPHGTPR